MTCLVIKRGRKGYLYPWLRSFVALAGESYFLPKPMPYRLQARHILLTYSQIDNENVFIRDALSHFNHCTSILGTLDVYRLGRESHQDGGTHFHAFVSPSSRCSTRNERLFDYHGYHPNVRAIPRTPWKTWDYVGKEHDIIHEHGERPGGDRAPAAGRDSAWRDALGADGKEAFLQHLHQHAPRDYVLYHDALLKFCERYFAQAPPPYESPTFEKDRIDELDCWLSQSCIGGGELWGRPRSLILWGPTRTGKTLWARSLGTYAWGFAPHPLHSLAIPSRGETSICWPPTHGDRSLPSLRGVPPCAVRVSMVC